MPKQPQRAFATKELQQCWVMKRRRKQRLSWNLSPMFHLCLGPGFPLHFSEELPTSAHSIWQSVWNLAQAYISRFLKKEAYENKFGSEKSLAQLKPERRKSVVLGIPCILQHISCIPTVSPPSSERLVESVRMPESPEENKGKQYQGNCKTGKEIAATVGCQSCSGRVACLFCGWRCCTGRNRATCWPLLESCILSQICWWYPSIFSSSKSRQGRPHTCTDECNWGTFDCILYF